MGDPCPYVTDLLSSVQRRPFLPLPTLKEESCPQISAHDLVTLCRLESHALNYNNHTTFNSTHDNPLLLRGGARGVKRSRQKAIIVDIRQQDEYRQGHVINSINVPQLQAFQADGSLSPSQSTSALGRIPRGRVIIVMGSKGDAGPVVSVRFLSHTHTHSHTHTITHTHAHAHTHSLLGS